MAAILSWLQCAEQVHPPTHIKQHTFITKWHHMPWRVHSLWPGNTITIYRTLSSLVQVNIWTNNNLLSIWPLEIKSTEIWINFFKEHIFGNSICKTAAIFPPQSVNMNAPIILKYDFPFKLYIKIHPETTHMIDTVCKILITVMTDV